MRGVTTDDGRGDVSPLGDVKDLVCFRIRSWSFSGCSRFQQLFNKELWIGATWQRQFF